MSQKESGARVSGRTERANLYSEIAKRAVLIERLAVAAQYMAASGGGIKVAGGCHETPVILGGVFGAIEEMGETIRNLSEQIDAITAAD